MGSRGGLFEETMNVLNSSGGEKNINNAANGVCASQSLQRQQQRGSGSSFSQVKRPRVSAEDSAPLRETLKGFGQRATALDAEVAAAVDSLSVSSQEKMWTLVLELRPYVFALLPSTESDLPTEMRELCHGDLHRAMKYSKLALRIYFSVTRIAASVPGIYLHCALTLLSLLPVAGTLPHSSAADEMFFKNVHHTLVVLHHLYPLLFLQLFRALLQEETMGAFIFSTTPGRRSSYGQCKIEITDPPEVHGVSGDTRRLFTATIAAETPHETVSVACGLCNIINKLLAAAIPLQPTLSERGVLLRLACSLFALDLGGDSVQRCDGSSNTETTGRSIGHTQLHGSNLSSSVTLHMNAGLFLRRMMMSGLLVKALHGPILLYTLTQHLYEKSRADLDDQQLVWELDLLQWLADKNGDDDNPVMQEGANNIDEASNLKVGKSDLAPRKWLEGVLSDTNVLIGLLLALIGCASDKKKRESHKAAALLLNLLREAVSHKNRLDGLLEQVFSEISGDFIDALFGLQALPTILWFADMSNQVSVLHQLIGFFPREVVVSLVERCLCSLRANAPSNAHLLEVVNASLVVCDGEEMQVSLLTNAWSQVSASMSTTDDALDAVVILLRMCEKTSMVKKIVLDFLGELVEGKVVLQRFKSHLHISLLYAELVRQLPFCTDALPNVVQALDVRDWDSETSLWRVTGVVRGFRERIALRCVCNMSTSFATQLNREHKRDEGLSVVLTSLEEVRVVLESLTHFIAVLSTKNNLYSADTQSLFWEQMVALATETLALTEWVFSLQLAVDFSSMKNNSNLGGGSSVEVADVVVVDVEDENLMDLGDVDVYLTSNRRLNVERGPRENVRGEGEKEIVSKDNIVLDNSNATAVLRGLSGALKAVGKVVQGLLRSRLACEDDTLGDTLLAFVCLCAAHTPVRCGAMEEFVLTHGMGHKKKAIRCGYAALSIRMIVMRWNEMGMPRSVFFTCLHVENEGTELLLQRLESLQAAFTDEWRSVLQHGMGHAGATSLPLAIVPSLCYELDSTVCHNILEVCIALWERDTTTLAVKSTALDVAHAIMTHLSWSLDDLCWRDTGVIFTSFFKAMCNLEERDVRDVILKNLDDLLPPSLLADDGALQLQRISALVGEQQFSLESKFPEAMAYILLHSARETSLMRLEKLQKILQLMGKRIQELPELINRSLGSLIVSLMYFEGERHMRMQGGAYEGVNRSNKKSGGNTETLSDFDVAIEMALSVRECGPSVNQITQSLETPTARVVDGCALTKYVFSILDTMARRVGISNGVEGDSYPVSIYTMQRWLCGLTSLIGFLGHHATLIAPKLPAILDHCCTRGPRLVRLVCAVWCDLLTNCTEEYLREHSPAIIIDLLSMEHLAELHDSAALPLLEKAMYVVHEVSANKAFWKLYFKVMGHTSVLIRHLSSRHKGISKDMDRTPAGAILNGEENSTYGEGDATVVVAGFLSVMQSSSIKCKEVFIRALFQYLSTTGNKGRMEMAHAAAENPQLIPTLLNCVCELRGEYTQYDLACVGMIGAIAPSHTSIVTVESRPLRHDEHAVTSVPPLKGGLAQSPEEEKLLSKDWLDWRSLAHKLLSVHCPRALANTADPTMHDRAAFAVQELLRVCTDTERKERGCPPLQGDETLHVEELERYSWWSKIEPSCQQMLEGYTTTRYTACVRQRAEPRSPVYISGMEFHVWLNSWFCDLVLRCEGIFGCMMSSLRNMAKGDQVLITFLIPHMILHFIRNGKSNDVDAVLAEINMLLKAAASASSRSSDMVFSLHSQNLMMEVATPAVPTAGIEEHVQQVFHVLEDMEQLTFVLVSSVHHSNVLRAPGANGSEVLRVIEACRFFLCRVGWVLKVEAAVATGSNMRALRCIESQRYLPTVHDIMQEGIPLQRVFAAVDDRDSSRSLHRTQELQPEDAAFSYENNGEWGQAIQACELVLQQRPDSITHQFTSLRCMQQLGQLHLMSRYSQALLTQATHSESTGTGGDKWRCTQIRLAALQNYANEAAWRLSEWENIEARLDLPVSLALPMLAFTNLLEARGTLQDVFSACALQRRKVTPIIRAACREGYAQVYPHVVVLHALTDIETAAESAAINAGDSASVRHSSSFQHESRGLQELGLLLHERARLTNTTLETQELLISLHRSIFRAFHMEEEVNKTWMHHAKLLRNEGFLEAALSTARQANLANGLVDPSYYTTIANILHEMNMPTKAIEFAEDVANNTQIPVVIRAKLRVLFTRWRQDIGYQTSQEVIASYEAALKMHASEKGYHFLALFYDTLYRSVQSSAHDLDAVAGKALDDVGKKKVVGFIESYVLRAVYCFGMALQLGGKTVTVSLPRMLTLWLDCSLILSEMASESSSCSVIAGTVLRKINSTVERYLLVNDSKLPASLLITALPQMLSRIGQSNVKVVSIITRTVVDLMGTFPQQCLWQVLPIVFGKQPNRREVARQDIVAQFVKLYPTHKKLVDNMSVLFKSLIELCNCPATAITNGGSSSEGSIFQQAFIQQIQRILPDASLILPTMETLSPNVLQITNSTTVFTGSATFHSFEDRVIIMNSLQKPKRITVIDNEGNRVPFLCKSKDEPRKDMRMMEITSLMNMFFLADPEARRKRFALRRYAVSALTDDCAIIEWVNNLGPFRKVVDECYAIDGTGVRISQVKAWKAKVDSGAMSKLDMMEKHILPKTRPVLHSWFHRSFLTHQEWFNARTIYTQSTALWSIAGHIVGLGDRHGENLMIDLRSGELMHVDFACMFDKGEMLEVPERVRFRLTQNVVDGMGVLGVDGPFRACCQAALRCQMKNKTAVMSVVETLFHDPLVEWTRQSPSRQNNFDPKRLIGRVSRRLDGFLDLYTPNHEKDTLALSCEGQVSRLISHSSALENLSEMYVWWMAWL